MKETLVQKNYTHFKLDSSAQGQYKTCPYTMPKSNMTRFAELANWKNIQSYAHLVAAIGFIVDIFKWLHEGSGFFLGLNWIIGMMISATLVAAFLGALYFALLPAALLAKGVDWAFSYLSFLPKGLKPFIGILAVVTGIGIWIELPEKAKDVMGVLNFFIAIIVGVILAFRVSPTDIGDFWAFVVRAIGWLALAFIGFIIVQSLKDRVPEAE